MSIWRVHPQININCVNFCNTLILSLSVLKILYNVIKFTLFFPCNHGIFYVCTGGIQECNSHLFIEKVMSCSLKFITVTFLLTGINHPTGGSIRGVDSRYNGVNQNYLYHLSKIQHVLEYSSPIIIQSIEPTLSKLPHYAMYIQAF